MYVMTVVRGKNTVVEYFLVMKMERNLDVASFPVISYGMLCLPYT